MQTKGATTIFPCYKQCLAVCLCGRQGHRQLGAAAGRYSTIQRHAQNLASNCSPQKTPLGLWQLTERPIALLLSPSAVTIPQVFPLRASFAWRRVAVATLHSSACTRVTVPCYRRSLLHTSPLPEAGGRNRHLQAANDQRLVEEEGKGRTLTSGERALRFVGWLGGFYSQKAVLSRSAKLLYESCIDTVDYDAFFRVCGLPDSFQSWFLVAHLHVWLCMVRLKAEGKNGKYLTREVVSTFWDDVQQRMRVLGVHSSSVASRSLRELVHEFYGLTLAYDEGLLRDDQTLASAVWRNLIHDKENTDPTHLAKMVEYIRCQVQHMDGVDSERLLNTGSIQLLPFSQDS